MRARKKISVIALVSTVVMMTAVAQAASGQPWPEAHSGAYLGVQVTAVTSERASALKLSDPVGAVIAYVDQDGPACRAGLQENDVVVGFDGSKVDGPEQLQSLIHISAPQKTVLLTIIRNGQRKEVKVTLGSWNVMSHVRAYNSSNLASPAPPRAYPDIEMPAFTLLSARHGLVVESLSPQLADFFGVRRGRGVLVRSVEGGSPAAAAGIKAGDVILKVNNEEVHDMSDWQRGMRAPGGKLWVVIWRDKKEQNFIINAPGAGDSSRLSPGDLLNFESDAQPALFGMDRLPPLAELAQLQPSEKEMQKMRRDLEKSLKARQKEMQKMSRELANAYTPSQKELEQMREEMQRSMPSQKEIDEMTRQALASMPSQQEMEQLKQQMQASLPSQKELEEMQRQVQNSLQDLTPQMQQEMEQLKKQMEQQKLDMQQMMQQFQRQED